MYSTTLIQFANAKRADVLREYPEVSNKEYDECYPLQSTLEEWRTALGKAADAGEQIHPRILDYLASLRGDEYPCIQFIKFHNRAIPDGYMLPSARKANALHERAMIDARKAKANTHSTL